MTPSVSPEADWELTKEAVFYAREGGAELGGAFVTEFERALTLLCEHPELGAPVKIFHGCKVEAIQCRTTTLGASITSSAQAWPDHRTKEYHKVLSCVSWN
jgi:hypothetical protein